jgi:NADH-quinone oxidoreductase subunit G
LDNGNLCEKGKFKFEYLGDKNRIIFPSLRKGKRLVHTGWDDIADRVHEDLCVINAGGIAVFVSPRLTDQEAYAAQRLARMQLGTNNIYPSGGKLFSGSTHNRLGRIVSPGGIEDIEACDAIIVIDPRMVALNEVAALSVIKAVRGGAKLLIIGHRKTKLDKLAWKKLPVTPNRLGDYEGELRSFIKRAGQAAVVYNRSCLDEETICALHNYAARHNTLIVSLTSEINEQGLLDAGVSPFVLPGQRPISDRAARKKLEREWNRCLPAWPAMGYPEAVNAMRRGLIKAALFLGDCSSEDPGLYSALRKVSFVVMQAIAPSPLTRLADVVLPMASWVEISGTFTRFDGEKLALRSALPPLCGFSNVEIWDRLLRQP